MLQALNITSADSKLPESMGFWTKVLPRLQGAGASSQITQSGTIEHGELCLDRSIRCEKMDQIADRFRLFTDHRQDLALKLKGRKGPHRPLLLAHPYAESVEASSEDEARLIDALGAMGMKYYKEKTTFKGHAAYRILIAHSDVNMGQVRPLLLGSDFVRREREGPLNAEQGKSNSDSRALGVEERGQSVHSKTFELKSDSCCISKP